MTFTRWSVLALALGCVLLALWRLEGARTGLDISEHNVGTTPVTVYANPATPPGPAVVIAHGFAGSRQLMEAFSLSLAHAGYVAVSFDFEGHGRNPVAMSGDVTSIDGTTRLLMAETGRVSRFARDLAQSDGRLALLGHSMASDIVVRQTRADTTVAATVAVSLFSQAVTATQPARLLAINGAWEPGLRQEARRVLRLIDPAAEEGQSVKSAGVTRRAVFAPHVEHVGVLYSATSLREAREWLDQTFGRQSTAPLATTGGWIALLLAGLVALAWPLAGGLPKGPAPAPLALRDYALALVAATLLAPLILAPVELRFLPVLVADYLGQHMLVFGALALGILYWRGLRLSPRDSALIAGALVFLGLGVFGLALDRYVAAFMPIPARWPIIAALSLGAVAFMLADAALTGAGAAPFWRRLGTKLGFLTSLGIAVALDPEGLFFLLIILPVIVLFFLIFGTMGGWAGRRSGAVMGVGIGLGLILAWSLGVSFPMFSSG